MSTAIVVRAAGPDDAATIHRFIVELAVYEREPDAVVTTPTVLRDQLASERPPFEARIALWGEEPVGFALFFPTYSTWRGRPGLWLEDFYVTPSARGKGVGEALFQDLLALAKARDYGRFELTALDWNELAHRFYEKRGLRRMNDWTTWRLDLG